MSNNFSILILHVLYYNITQITYMAKNVDKYLFHLGPPLFIHAVPYFGNFLLIYPRPLAKFSSEFYGLPTLNDCKSCQRYHSI